MKNVGSRFAGGQIVGDRGRQEDDFGIVDLGNERLVMVLADGMGGHAGGAEAAHCAVKRFLEVVEHGEGDLMTRLLPALWGANAAVADLVRNNVTLQGAGCTLVGALAENGYVSWASVGDSSLLLLRNGTIRRLNDDHSMRPVYAAMVEAGRMSAADAATNPTRNALRSAVTGEELNIIDQSQSPLALQPGDQLALASDGLDTLGEQVIADTLLKHSASPTGPTVRAVLEAVSRAGKPNQDNTTLILYRPSAAAFSSWPATRRTHRLVIAVGLLILLLFGAGSLAWWLGQSAGSAERTRFVAAPSVLLNAKSSRSSGTEHPPAERTFRRN